MIANKTQGLLGKGKNGTQVFFFVFFFNNREVKRAAGRNTHHIHTLLKKRYNCAGN